MKRFNITTIKSYEKNGEEKKTYPQVGKLVKFEAIEEKPESYILELNMFPNTKFYVFEEKEKDSTPAQNRTVNQSSKKQEEVATIQYPVDEENPDDIPF